MTALSEQHFIINSAVYDNYVISKNSDRILTYYDLSERTSSPACTTSGCDHSDPKSCTANLSETVARFPFRYGESIYFTDYSLDGKMFLLYINAI